MSLFHRSSRSELPETVLNEAAAMNTEAAPAEGPPAAPETEEAAAAPLPAREAGLTGSDAVCARPDPEAEQRWQEAARSVAGHWPQIKDDLPALLGRMKAISERYGDPALWQRSPAGIMREAAVELYGMPARPDAGALSQAVRAAHEQGRRAAADRRRALAGLEPPQVSRSAPPPLTEEERIRQDMRRARRGRLF